MLPRSAVRTVRIVHSLYLFPLMLGPVLAALGAAMPGQPVLRASAAASGCILFWLAVWTRRALCRADSRAWWVHVFVGGLANTALAALAVMLLVFSARDGHGYLYGLGQAMVMLYVLYRASRFYMEWYHARIRVWFRVAHTSEYQDSLHSI